MPQDLGVPAMHQLAHAILFILMLAFPQLAAAQAEFDICFDQPGLCSCNWLPPCPDLSTPLGQVGFCGCPRPVSCDQLTYWWQCTFFAGSGWACECTYVGPPDEPGPGPDPPLLPPDPFCAHVVCSDGSAALFDGFNCLCPQD
jgi:hypothetical protein